jgi:hypothetical protein
VQVLLLLPTGNVMHAALLLLLLLLLLLSLQVIDAINALAVGQPDNTATAEAGAVITDCGQIHKGTHVPDLEQM